MSSPVPFGRLLDVLRDSGIALGVSDYLALGRLVAKYDGDSPTELRDAIAALLGRDQHEVERIARQFDDEFLPRPPPPPTLWPRIRRIAMLAITVVALGIIAVPVFFQVVPRINKVPPNIVISPPVGNAEPPQPQPPDRCEPMQSPVPAWTERRPLPAVVGALVSCVALIGVGLLARRRYQSWQRKTRRHRLDRLPGPRHYSLGDGPRQRRFARELLDDVAAALTTRTMGNELDVSRTIERSVRAGVPKLAYLERQHRFPLTILLDNEPEMRAFRSAALELADGLKRRGVSVSVMPFVPSAAPPEDAGATFVISTGSMFRDRDAELPAWLRGESGWRRVAWLQPIDDTSQWPEPLRAAHVFAFVDQGLLAAAKYVAGLDPAQPRTAHIAWEDVVLLRALVALSPDRSPEVVEHLRRRLLPGAAQATVLAVFDEPLPDPDEASRVLGRLRPGLEEQGRRFLLDILDQARPEEGSAAYLRWRRDRALLMRALPDVKLDAERVLRSLATTPIADHVPDIAPAPLVREAGDPPRPSRLGYFTAALANLALGAGVMVLPVAKVSMSRVVEADRLQLEVRDVGGGERELFVRTSDMLTSLGIYDSHKDVKEPVATWPVGPIRIEPGSHCFQAWATRIDGAVLSSAPVRVEDVEFGNGTLLVASNVPRLESESFALARSDTQESFEGQLGKEIELEPGRWKLSFALPGYEPFGETVEIAARSQITIDIDPRLKIPKGLQPVVFVLPASVSMRSLLVDDQALSSLDTVLPPGPHTLASSNPFEKIEPARFQVSETERNVISVKATTIGIVRFNVTPEEARRNAELLTSTDDRFTVSKLELRGLGTETITVRAPNFRNAFVKVTARPRQKTTVDVPLVRQLVQRDVFVTIDNKSAAVKVKVIDPNGSSVEIVSGQRVALGAGLWSFEITSDLGSVVTSMTVNTAKLDTAAPLTVPLKTGVVYLGPLPPQASPGDLTVDGKPVNALTVRKLEGSIITIQLKNELYDFTQRVKVSAKVTLQADLPRSPQFGYVEVDAPADADVFARTRAVPEQPISFAGERRQYKIRLPIGQHTIEAVVGADSATRAVDVAPGSSVSVVFRQIPEQGGGAKRWAPGNDATKGTPGSDVTSGTPGGDATTEAPRGDATSAAPRGGAKK